MGDFHGVLLEFRRDVRRLLGRAGSGFIPAGGYLHSWLSPCAPRIHGMPSVVAGKSERAAATAALGRRAPGCAAVGHALPSRCVERAEDGSDRLSANGPASS